MLSAEFELAPGETAALPPILRKDPAILREREADVEHHCLVDDLTARLEAFERCCQTNSNQSLLGQRSCPLCRAKLAPFGKSSGAVEFEIGST